jgi:site-specific DNA-adenine methylase
VTPFIKTESKNYLRKCPNSIEMYAEPFGGAAPTLLEVMRVGRAKSYWFNDTDPAILELWMVVKTNHLMLLELLRDLPRDEQTRTLLEGLSTKGLEPALRAARTLWLLNDGVIDPEAIKAAHKVMDGKSILFTCQNFNEVLIELDEDDVALCDPPKNLSRSLKKDYAELVEWCLADGVQVIQAD